MAKKIRKVKALKRVKTKDLPSGTLIQSNGIVYQLQEVSPEPFTGSDIIRPS